MERMMSIMFISFALLTFGMCIFFENEHSEISNWPETDCQITYSAPASWSKHDVGDSISTIMYAPDIKYSYNVNGKDYFGNKLQPGESSSSDEDWAQEICNKYPEGGNFSCFYNPDSPEESYLEKEPAIGTLTFWGLGILFLALGIGCEILGRKLKDSTSEKTEDTDKFDKIREKHRKIFEEFKNEGHTD